MPVPAPFDAARPDAARPDAARPDAARPDAARPDAADAYDDAPHHLAIAASLPTDLAVPADEAGAARIARAAGFGSVRVTTTSAPRRSFLVFADVAA